MSHRVEEILLSPVHGVAVRATVPLSGLPAFFGAAFREMGDAVGGAGAQIAGAPFARYHTAPPAAIDVEAIMPVTGQVAASGRVRPVELNGGPALQVRHVGRYDAMAPAYAAIAQWMKEHKLQPSDAPREVYLSDPQTVPDQTKWETLVIQPTTSGP